MIGRSRRTAAGFAVLLALLVAGQAMAITWGTRLKLADGSTAVGAFHQTIASTGSVAHQLFNTDAGVLKFRRTTNLGASWASAQTLQSATADVGYAAVSIASDGQLVVALYLGVDGPANRTSLILRRSEDAGVTWKSRQVITSWTGQFGSQHAAVDIAGSLVVLVYTDPITGAVYARRSTDGAKTFLTPQSLGTSTFESIAGGIDAQVAAAITGTNVVVVWIPSAIEGDVFGSALVGRRSANSGQTWVTRQTIDSSDIDLFNGPSIDADGTTVLVHYQRSDGRLIVARSIDSGVAYARTSIATPSAAYVYFGGDVFIGPGGLARLVFIRFSDTDDRVLIRTSANGGGTWTAASTAISSVPTYKLEAAVVANTTYTLVATEAFPDAEPFLTEIHARRGTN